MSSVLKREDQIPSLHPEGNRGERLVLGGGGNLAFGCEVGDESLYFLGAHVFGMALLVEEYVAFDPIHVGLFGAVGVVLGA